MGFGASAGAPTELAAEGSAELAAAGFDLRELARRRCARTAMSRQSVERGEAVCGSALRVGVGAHGRVLTQPERAARMRGMLTLRSVAKDGGPILRPVKFPSHRSSAARGGSPPWGRLGAARLRPGD